MNAKLKTTVNQLPEILSRNAPSMMRRMVVAMQSAIAQDQNLTNSTYSALVLKVSEADLVREFDAALKDALAQIKAGSGKTGHSLSGGLSLELANDLDTSATDDFPSSTASFEKLNARALDQQVEGVDAFKKDVFLNALKDAFLKSRVESVEAARLMPYARRALNAELTKLYEQLHSL